MGAQTVESVESQQSEWLEAGEYLKVAMARRGFNAVSLAKKIGVTPQSIYNVTGETRRAISAGLAHKLSQELGGTFEFWMGDRFPNYALKPEASSGLGPRSPGIQVDRRLLELNGRDEDGFIISPFDKELVQGASIDLTMGLFVERGFDRIAKEARDCWFSFCQLDIDVNQFAAEQRQQFEALRTQNDLQYCSELVLKPGASTIVIASQYVRMGLRYLGLLGQTNEENLRGLIVHCGHQIDPGFNGPLIFRVKNDSDEPLALKRGGALASLTVIALPEPVEKGYGKNRASQIRGVVDKLRAALSGCVMLDSGGAGWQLSFGDNCFTGVSRKSVVSAFFAWLDGQLASNGDSAYALFSGVEISADDIGSLGRFIEADQDAIADAIEQAQTNGKARLFGKAVSNLTDKPPVMIEAYRRVSQELRSLIVDLEGEVI